jgi:ADP-ribose pyrophosphatase YjhB (NUDIX family)
MMQNINIYIEKNKIIIGNMMNIKDGVVKLIAGVRQQDIHYLIEEVVNKKEALQITPADGQNVLDLFKQECSVIEAGGGIVRNEYNEILFIFRNGKWDLPKGKLEPNEDIAECSVREVEEETGCQQITLQEFAKHTYHIYKIKERYVLKQTHWYFMTAPKQTLTPQMEEGITAVKWIVQDDLQTILENTYDNIKELF